MFKKCAYLLAVSAFSCVLLSVAAAAQVVQTPVPMPDIDTAIQNRLTTDGGVGAVVGIVKGNSIIYLEDFGYSDRENNIPMQDDRTMIRWASTSKSLTGIAAVIAERDRKLSLDTRISSYYKDYKEPTRYLPAGCKSTTCSLSIPSSQRGITMRKLLTHTAGIQHYSNGVGQPTPSDMRANNPSINTGIAWAMPLFINNPLVAIPSTAFNYSSFGFNLAGVTLEKATKTPYAQYIKNKIATPMGLATLQPDYQWVNIPNRAIGYEKSSTGSIVRENHDADVSWKAPSGGYISTGLDFAKYCGGLMGQNVLSDSVKQQTIWKDSGYGYGLGFVVGTSSQGKPVVLHNGDQEKSATRFVVYPEEDLCFIFMSNDTHLVQSSYTNLTENLYRQKYAQLAP